VPVQLPGGVPIGIQVPEVKLPKRADKPSDQTASSQIKVPLVAVDGTLREMEEKAIFVEVSGKRVLRFRLLVKTEFRGKDGQPIRDSLLKPGDQLTIQANQVDPETALRVILARSGTPAERTAAARPFDKQSAQTPADTDMHPAGSLEVAPPPTAPTSAPAPAPAPAPADPPVAPRDTDIATIHSIAGGAMDEIVTDAKVAADAFNEQLPNFLVEQATSRYYSNTSPADWKLIDVVTMQVRSVNGKEEYSNVLVNGRPSSQPLEKSGSWSTGEFVLTLQDILSPYTGAAFERHGEDTIGGRDAYVYTYTVRKENSHWVLQGPAGQSDAPAYKGRLWIDKELHRVLRIEQQAVGISTALPHDKAECTVEYGFVSIDGKSYLLPVHSANLACERGKAACTRNDIDFRNYRKFTAESNVTFGKLFSK
jgi:hypothetical protein